MKKWLAIGLALLVLSGLVMGVSITLDFITLDMQMTHEQHISTVHALNVMEYTALSFQVIGAWVTWGGVRPLEATKITEVRDRSSCLRHWLVPSYVRISDFSFGMGVEGIPFPGVVTAARASAKKLSCLVKE